MNWRSLELLPGLIGLPDVWRTKLDGDLEAFQTLCLQPTDWLPKSLLCSSSNYSCSHRIVRNQDGSVVGTCPQNACPARPLTLFEITPLIVDWPKLARAICRALSRPPKISELAPPRTWQISSWSSDDVPIILTIQHEPMQLRMVITELHARLHRPFILLTPTTHLVDAVCQELVTNAKAAIFPLETTFRLTDHGTLVCLKTPGQLFAQFTPQPKELDEDVARRAFALIERLDPETITVFRLYCIEGLSAAQVARKANCSRATVYRRLEIIRAKTGIHPRQLRRISAHLDKLEDQIADSRATHLHRKRLINDDSEG